MQTSFAFAGLLVILPACIHDSAADHGAAAANLNVNPEEISHPAAAVQLRPLKGFHTNIERATRANRHFRQVLYTGRHLQLVLMSLKPGEEIGSEVHQTHDQFFRFEAGAGECVVNGHRYPVAAGDVVIAPAGSTHNVINTDAARALQLYTLYAPPQHQDGIVRTTKLEATERPAPFKGHVTE
ncbi:cupin domain-containing protein [Hymenobacter sp. 15J16-1T3B]|uniref:cupin domain-containing protein n=1 Tax=Hymenobacter sp. 15J16-1T3B TaxID=2886941 RepID=UPI001D11B6A2|nr:cupin domain-containing protein [Hymenobacter sp. 15J16-1T3B]MCC3159730.1 cupin domain-containing protein [Hymenobacter sp. 15J16-1T3B]